MPNLVNPQFPLQTLQPIYYKQEGFPNEGKKLKAIYDEYCKNLGGYQKINGKLVHNHTVLHSDRQVANMLIEMQKRLKALGVLPTA